MLDVRCTSVLTSQEHFKFQTVVHRTPYIVHMSIFASMQEASKNIFEDGQVLLINKPLYWTSFDAVKKIRNMIGIKKVGHAGTLDPLATGLLIICTGRFTKRINEFMAQEKEYTGEFVLGAITPTYDLESEPIEFKPFDHLTNETIQAATNAFIGEIWQVPP